MMTEIKYLANRSIRRRILEFPPVKTDEDLQNFYKLIGRMYIELEPYLRGKIGQQLDQTLLMEFETAFPFAYFEKYGSHLLVNFKRDYLDERNMCIGLNGKIERKMLNL